MEKEFVPQEESIELKKLGFNEPCFGYYDEGGNLYTEMVEVLKAPLYQQAFRWFREKYNYAGFIQLVDPEYGGDYGYAIYYNLNYLAVDHWNKGFKTYEEAELACLDKLIKICKEKKS